MTGRRLGAWTALLTVCALALSAILAGCGGVSAAQRIPTAASVPLLPGSRIVTQVRACDQGSNAYCAIDLVVRNSGYNSSDILLRDEGRLLKKDGWSLAHGDTGAQSAANSPGHKLRLTFSTAAGDLQEVDLGAINRPWPIVFSLSSSMFARAATMSMMLEVGSS
jgi:hypothetical protein